MHISNFKVLQRFNDYVVILKIETKTRRYSNVKSPNRRFLCIWYRFPGIQKIPCENLTDT